ncbi:MAG: hypothetical protein ACJATI_001687 [Halioglobus sp.]
MDGIVPNFSTIGIIKGKEILRVGLNSYPSFISFLAV